MRINSRHLALVAVVAGAIAPSTAMARPDIGPLPWAQAHHAAQAHCGKDYSRNSVTGDYCDPVTTGHAAPVSTPIRRAPAPEPVATSDDSGFSWGDAGAGAGAVALIAVTAGGAIALRRRSTASVN
jgi:hypothetical protein